MPSNPDDAYDVRSFFVPRRVSQEEIDAVQPDVERAILELANRAPGDKRKNDEVDDAATVPAADPSDGDGDEEFDNSSDDDSRNWEMKPSKARLSSGDDSTIDDNECFSDDETEAGLDAIIDKARDYQNQFFELAKERNIIVHLGTGMGKTLIAVLLIKHYLELEDRSGDATHNSKPKRIVFVVPSNALAIQQCDSLRANLDCSVGMASYRQELKGLRRDVDKAQNESLRHCRVLVTTHGALLNLFNSYRDAFDMRDVSLLILDECHNCVKKSPYAQIMLNLYRPCPLGQRPRVLGLTASPVINYKTREGLARQLDDLEELMGSRVVSVHTLGYQDPSLLAKKADEESVRVDDRQDLPRDYPKKDRLRLLKGRLKELNQLDELYLNVGPAVVSPYADLLLNSIEIDHFEGESEVQFHAALDFVRRLRRYCQVKTDADASMRGRSKKLEALERLLNKQVSERSDAVGIVFVKMRVTALALNHYFSTKNDALENKTETNPGRNCDIASCEDTIVSGLTLPTVFRAQEVQEEVPLANNGGLFANGQSGSAGTHHLPGVPEIQEPSVAGSGATDMDAQFDDADEDATKGVVQCVFIPNESPGEMLPNNPPPEKAAQISLVSTIIPSNKDLSTPEPVTDSDVNPRIRTGVLVGRTSDLFKKAIMWHEALNDSEVEMLMNEIEEQDAKTRVVLQKLRRGDINVLIATSVVEEGVDVKACSFVVSFDSIDSIKSYVQMKGRARQQNAKLYAFEADLSDLAAIELLILKFLRSRTKSRPPALPVLMVEHEVNEWEALRNGVFSTEQGRVTTLTAPNFLYRFILSQPRDTTEVLTRQSLEAYFPQFSVCGNKLTLPAYISDHALRTIVLPTDMQDRSLQDKKRLLALAACVRLYRMRLLSERFLPLNEEDVIPWLERIAKLPAALEPTSLPTFPLADCTLYVYRIVQDCKTLATFQNVLSGDSVDLAVISSANLSDVEMPNVKQNHPELGLATLRLVSLGQRTFTKSQLEDISKFFTTVIAAMWHGKGNEPWQSFYTPVDDRSNQDFRYLVGYFSRPDAEPLWELMNRACQDYERSDEERLQAVRQQQCGFDGFLEPRTWTNRYSFDSYVVYGDSGLVGGDPYSNDSRHDKTYREYLMSTEGIQVDPTSPLFVAQRIWQLPFQSLRRFSSDMLQLSSPESSRYRLCEGLQCVVLPRDGDVCIEAPIANPSLLLASTFLPRFLYGFEGFLRATRLLEHCSYSLKKIASLLRYIPVTDVMALLTPSTGKRAPHARSIWLGKSIMKLVLTDFLTTSVSLDTFAQNAHAGVLHMMRGLLGSYERLRAHCVRLGLATLILTPPYRCDSWSPLPIALPPRTERSTRELLESNAYSDFVGALLNLAFSKGGYKFAVEISTELGLTPPVDGRALEQRDVTETHTLPERSLDLANELTSYNFGHCQNVLQEALTHPTKRNARTRCYQRLAWIGDAVLSVAVRDWVCKNFPGEPVKIKDLIETSMVCNETLAFLSLRNGIYKHIDHSYAVLPGQISAYERSIAEDGRGLWSTEPPKALADVVESVIGAAHVHGGFEHGIKAALTALEPVTELFYSTYVSGGDSWTRLLHHPKRALKELAGKAVRFPVTAETSFARRYPHRRVWSQQIRSNQSESYRLTASTAHSAGRRSVASISCRFRGNDSHLLSVAEECPSPAVNRACELALSVLNQNDALKNQIIRFAHSYRPRNVVGGVDDEGDFDWDCATPI